MIKLLRAVAFLLCTAVSAPAMAQNYAEGLEAYQAGDYETALQEWRPLAEQGNGGAQFNLGIMYRNGDGVIQDYAVAADWYRKAAEQGHARAQNNLGYIYENGNGVIQDDVIAHMWFNISSANGRARGSRDRGVVEERMTSEQIAEAQAFARRCMASDYQDCG